MNISKKFLASVGWIMVSIAAMYGFGALRHIGTAWTDNAGFIRLLWLSLFSLLLIVMPVMLALLVWVGRPKKLYKKLGHAR